MTPKRAEEIAILALEWIAGDADLTAAFLGQSGASVDDLRTGADAMLMDDRATEAFVIAENLAPTDPMMARQFLPGGDLPNWT